jgi:hypothetical protein
LILFCDTSALVKLYVREAFSEEHLEDFEAPLGQFDTLSSY